MFVSLLNSKTKNTDKRKDALLVFEKNIEESLRVKYTDIIILGNDRRIETQPNYKK